MSEKVQLQPAVTEPSPARTRAPRAADGGGSGTAADGAQSSNRAPSNSNPEKITPLLFGIDSLYLSFPGDLSEAWERQLEHLKLLAQSESEKEQALAQLKIGEHLFEVSDHGAKRFPYTRPSMRKLAPGEKVNEHGITFERQANGDGVFTVNVMVDGQRIHRVIGRETDGTTRTQAEEFIEKGTRSTSTNHSAA